MDQYELKNYGIKRAHRNSNPRGTWTPIKSIRTKKIRNIKRRRPGGRRRIIVIIIKRKFVVAAAKIKTRRKTLRIGRRGSRKWRIWRRFWRRRTKWKTNQKIKI